MSDLRDNNAPDNPIERQQRTEIRVYVNERGITVPVGSTVLDAVRTLFPEDAQDIEQGRSRLTDSRGLPADEQQLAVDGAIFRVVAVRDRAAGVA
jgi:hypothetical protein